MLRALLFCCLVSGTEISFQYQSAYRRSNEPCKICYGDDCLQMSQARCEYYVETDEILREEEINGEENPTVRAEVDQLLYRFMEKASATPTECVPLVSQYTDCTKENICIGCKTCNCDITGTWNCTTVTKCRPEDMDVDHRILVLIMENLMNAQTGKRTKRYVDESQNKLSKNKISFDEISQWMFEDAPLSNAEERTESNVVFTTVDNETITPIITETTSQTENPSPEPTPILDYLGFDEVLNNIAVDSKSYSRRKPLEIVHNDSVAFDYMLFDEENATEAATEKSEYENIENKYDPSNMDGETDIVIDLLESAKKNQGETFTANWTDYTETDNKLNVIDPALDYIDNFVIGSKNVMKRDTLLNNQQTTQIKTKKANITNNVNELRNNVLLPLSNIINDKQKELEELLRVSENLIKIMRTYKYKSNETNLKSNEINEYLNSSVSIYNFEIAPEFENNFRRSDQDLLHEYVTKLKRDIYEVIRDIAGIQKFKGTTNVPQDLKILLRAMKKYVRNQVKLNDKGNKLDIQTMENRRNYDNTNDNSKKISLVNEFVDILKVIDRNRPESNALAPLSSTSRKIIYRVIKNNYVNEFSVIGLRVFDPEYNLTKDLGKIGIEWPRMTNNVGLSDVNDKLHAMKLLHLVLSVDIMKMNDAMALLDFAYSRRMILVEGNLGGELVERINKGLKAINDKVKVIIKLHNYRQFGKHKKMDVTKKVKKDSFLRKLKNILKSSKSEILSMLKKKIPKKDIVKGLAKRKLDDITRRRFMEFEDTMKKWQNKLNLVPRDKRSARDDNYKNHMKSILPKYLRGKVKPAIAAKKSKKRKQRNQNKHSKSSTTTVKTKLTSKPINSKPHLKN